MPPNQKERSNNQSFLLITVITLFCVSCAFQGTRNSGKYTADPAPERVSIARALTLPEENLTAKTGIYTLENGGKSFISRLWLVDHTQKTIDIQYYSFASDVTGTIVWDHIIRAADRGVKVRLLIDDAASLMRSHEIRLLDSHDNIEIRVYNAGLMLGRLDRRIKKLGGNFNRLLRRMHNKAVIFDGQVCITGGRNIADQYFDYDHRFNFRDRDVLLMGKAVTGVTRSFEKFWNDTLTVVYSELSGNSKKKQSGDAERFERIHADAAKDYSQSLRDKVKAFPEEIRAATKAGEFVWVGKAVYISDEPGKNEDRKDREGGICTDSLICLIQQAKTSIDIQSPYFITTEVSKKLLREAVQRGVKVRLLTNSLASIDNIEAYSGYQKDRAAILETGALIYEFKPDSKERYKLMIPEVQEGLKYKPVYGFHSKTIVIDGYISVIGSYNFDPRSANYNTECITIIRSGEVAGNLLKHIEEEFLPENSWHVTKDYNPDAEAGLKKRIQAASKRILPKKLL
ncbi:MAG: phospholipase family protein [Bacteroidetes bacterium]|nr:phospholipase family protein [Bacteroidota bacterium]